MRYIVGLIIVVIIATAAFIITGRDNDENNGSNQRSQPTNQTTNPTSNNLAPISTDKLTISNFSFSPADITVKKGTTVTWTNNDNVAHTVTKDSGNGPDSELLNKGELYSFAFNETGSFNYHCEPHPQMHGTVTVTE